jgi:hypothetical protein
MKSTACSAEMVSYRQPALDTCGRLIIYQLMQLMSVPLGGNVGCPADEHAPDLAASLDQPAILGGVLARRSKQPLGAARSVASARFGWTAELVRVCSIRISEPGDILCIGQQVTVSNLPEAGGWDPIRAGSGQGQRTGDLTCYGWPAAANRFVSGGAMHD